MGTLTGCSGDKAPIATLETNPGPIATAGTPAQHLILATTTSTDNSGLLAYLLPDFEAAHDTRVDVVAVGTGQALQLGVDGNADVLLVHARAREDQFMADGHGS
ncbi:MAG: tungsten ABC transporter substrate-binding protein, partial [Ardenticatenales bacterium]|nr:tungsten ABC transporter substrate-binding protein [Ardenticatenales bacterium]